jgi:ACS family pantothenate transporter-like MFS transporter
MHADNRKSTHCIVTQPLNYFAVWLKSLNRFSVYQINLFPTAAQALALVTTLAYGWASDGLGGKRWQVLVVPAVSSRLEKSSCTWIMERR